MLPMKSQIKRSRPTKRMWTTVIILSFLCQRDQSLNYKFNENFANFQTRFVQKLIRSKLLQNQDYDKNKYLFFTPLHTKLQNLTILFILKFLLSHILKILGRLQTLLF